MSPRTRIWSGKKNDDICVRSAVNSVFEGAQLQLRTDLPEHLGKLVNQADYSDLEFVCSDGIRVKASKLLLIGRSAVFDKMLTNGMLESSQSTIRLPEFSSSVLLYLLDILYAGNSVRHPLTSWTMALEAVSAADFFFLPDVTKIIRKFLWDEVEEVVEAGNLSEAASMLTAAVMVKCIVNDGDHILLELVRFLRNWWPLFECAVNLSEEAVDFILRTTKCNLKEALSMDEYFRIRGVILWGVLHDKRDTESAKEAKELVDDSIPFRKDDLLQVDKVVTAETKIVWLTNFDKFDLKDGKLCQLLTKEGCKDAIVRLLRNVDLRRIPAALLLKIIAPLQILPSSQYRESEAFNEHLECYCKWIHGPFYATDKRGFVIYKCGSGQGRAVYCPAADYNDGVLQWRFCLDKVAVHPECCFLGLARGSRGNLAERAKNAGQSSGSVNFLYLMKIWHLNTLTGISIYPSDKKQLNSKEFFIDSGSITVSIRFDRETRLCTASVEGHKRISCCCKISGYSDIFPAVDLGTSSGPRVEMSHMSGFRFF